MESVEMFAWGLAFGFPNVGFYFNSSYSRFFSLGTD